MLRDEVSSPRKEQKKHKTLQRKDPLRMKNPWGWLSCGSIEKNFVKFQGVVVCKGWRWDGKVKGF